MSGENEGLRPAPLYTHLYFQVLLGIFLGVVLGFLRPETGEAMRPLGDGFIDLEAFFTGLKEGGFNGYVAYEMCSPVRGGGSEANLDATATKSLQKIQQLIG